MLTSLRSLRSSWRTSLGAPAKTFARALLVLPLLAIVAGCSTDVGDTSAAVILNIDTIVLESEPWGDVLTSGGIIPDDVISVTFSAFLKAPISTDPSIVTPEMQNVNLERYEVTFTRTDGGTAVPPGFVRGISGTVRITALGQEEPNQLTLGLTLVPSTTKAQVPISYLIDPGIEPDTNFPNIQVNARIQFFGKTIAGDQVSVVGNVGINFANFGDENS